MVKIGVLWKAKEGSKAVLTGKIGDANLLIFKNKYKEKDIHPDYVVYVATPRKKEQEEVQEEAPESDDTELPF